MPIESSSACSLPASVFVTAPHRRRAHTERRRSRQAARSRFRPRMRMPGPAFLATFLVTNLRETRYPDESQLRCPGFAAPPSTDLSFDGIDGMVAHSQPFDHLPEIATRSLSPELVFDDLRERFSSIFEPREYLVGFHVDGDRFYRHALIMNLTLVPLKSVFWEDTHEYLRVVGGFRDNYRSRLHRDFHKTGE